MSTFVDRSLSVTCSVCMCSLRLPRRSSLPLRRLPSPDQHFLHFSVRSASVTFIRYGAVTYEQIKVTDKKMQKCLFGDGSPLCGGESHRGSGKERIRTRQVTDKEWSTYVRIAGV